MAICQGVHRYLRHPEGREVHYTYSVNIKGLIIFIDPLSKYFLS